MKLQLTERTQPNASLRPTPRDVANPMNPSRSQLRVVQAAALDSQELFRSLGTTPQGLARDKALIRRTQRGLNEIAHEQPPQWYVQLLRTFKNPFILLLIGLAIVSGLTADYPAMAIIGVMVIVSVLLRFVQEQRSTTAAERLRAMVGTTATVCCPDGSRDTPVGQAAAFRLTVSPHAAKTEEVPIKCLVPGDVVQLSAGDMIPADVRLLTSKDLFVSQSLLSGESLPIEKSDVPGKRAAELLATVGTPLDLPNICFMGTNVVSGAARALVVATGNETYLGSLAKHVVGKRAPTGFDLGVNRVSWLLIRFMLVMVPVVFVVTGWTHGNWVNAFFFAISVAVGLTPEMLPMIVTANLARGAVAMARQKVIVKRLSVMQDFGAMDVLCTDKTGTLTQDRVVLIQHLDVVGQEDDGVFEYACLNSHFQTGLKNLLDRAILDHEDPFTNQDLSKRYLKCDEIPFDFNRRRMSVVVHEVLHGRDRLICKGAVDEVLTVCKYAHIGGHTVPLTETTEARARVTSTNLNEDGVRVIAVAFKELESQPGKQYTVADEDNLVLCGFVAFFDPPKETAGPAIAALRRHGVAVKILTGDNELVAQKTCKDVGIIAPVTLTGGTIATMSDEELEEAVEATTLFAKLSPQQKARIVRVLKGKGHTVGFLGDGMNDGPALREADIGISVDTGADIARESAEIILLEKSLLVLEHGVLLGRATYGNIIKYIKMAASSNFGNMLSVMAAAAWLPFLPMLPLQILIQNLLYDFSQTAIPFDHVDPEYLESPRKWLVGDIGRFMLLVGPISSIFDLTTFALMWFLFAANTPGKQALFQSGWFVEGLLSQTLIIHMIRTAKVPFLQSTPAISLLLLSAAIMAIGIAIPVTPLGGLVGLVPLPGSYFPWLAATLLSYCALTQVAKMWYIRRFGMWL
ncbi:MAG: magnesium-translocating P-type ATPase [Thermoguttaceae bacterium]